MSNTLPAIFFGHGNPMNVVSNNSYAEAWRRVGEAIPRRRAVLSISAHWYVPGTAVTVSTAPRTIPDPHVEIFINSRRPSNVSERNGPGIGASERECRKFLHLVYKP